MISPNHDAGQVDPIEETGCQVQNDAVLLCYAETKDWRKCKQVMEEFKLCMELHKSKSNKARLI